MAELLLIEDDPAVAESIIFVLENNNHRVTHAVNLDRMRKILEAGQKFDAAIVDIWLDGEDGLSAFSKEADHAFITHKLPFIVISGGAPGKTLEAATARADAYGAVAMLYKPFSDEELLSAIDKAVSG